MPWLKFEIGYVIHGEYSFWQYLYQTDNLTETLDFSILKKRQF